MPVWFEPPHWNNIKNNCSKLYCGFLHFHGWNYIAVPGMNTQTDTHMQDSSCFSLANTKVVWQLFNDITYTEADSMWSFCCCLLLLFKQWCDAPCRMKGACVIFTLSSHDSQWSAVEYSITQDFKHLKLPQMSIHRFQMYSLLLYFSSSLSNLCFSSVISFFILVLPLQKHGLVFFFFYYLISLWTFSHPGMIENCSHHIKIHPKRKEKIPYAHFSPLTHLPWRH